MSAVYSGNRHNFQRVGDQELKCLNSPALSKPVEWVNFENVTSLNNELGRLEAKKWWGGTADTAGWLWHINEMRGEAGLAALWLREIRPGCCMFVETGDETA